MMLTTSALAQNIRGSVHDAASKQALTGATVQVENTNTVAVTDEQGLFSITVPAKGKHILIVKFLGYETQRVAIEGTQTNELNIVLKEGFVLTDEVVIRSTRADVKSPTTFLNVEKPTLEKQNFGQDLPFVLNWTPSVVTTSDAGAGIGYTGLRIRGSDATRINVTINGIPYNDSESQGTFWVNMPDISSSTQSIQIQRGVGTSTNGGSSFGGSINLQTDARNEKPHAELINSFGSFGSRRHTLGFGTGLIKNKIAIDGRLSQIASDGFIDRASSDLRSYYFSGAYYGKNTIIKALAFGGQERTYQSWYGVPASRLNNDVEAMEQTVLNEGWNEEQRQNLLNSNSRTFNPYTYENQVDDYGQYHYQLHVSQQISSSLTGNIAIHYTKGSGFYEEYRYDDDFENYGLSNPIVDGVPVESSDMIRRRWLDNDFYGTTYSLAYDQNEWNLVFGGAWNRYVGDHFGEVLWSAVPNVPSGYQYYFNIGDKHDFTTFLKANYQVTTQLNAYLDLQYRGVSYKASGKENKQFDFLVNESYNFFNPKAGLTYAFNEGSQVYASVALANREPVRDDFVDNPGATPQHENMTNLEMGYRKTTRTLMLYANFYYMNYSNQLVLTGALNDVGANIRTNVDKSHRAGIEVEGTLKISSKFNWSANLTLSENKIENFTEVVYDDGNAVSNAYKNTDISFSPNTIAGSIFSYTPFAKAEVSLLTKYVGRQYLDNTSNKERSIDAYLINDIRVSYVWTPSFVKEITVSLLVNNIFNEEYESNGYTWGYQSGGTAFRENYYYPQAGTNFLAMLAIKI